MTAVQAVDQRRSHSALIAALLGAAGAFLGFNLLLSAVPVIAARTGGDLAAGVSTGVFMFTTVLGQLTVGPITRVMPHRLVFVLGLMLIGLPTLLFMLSERLPLLFAVTAVRGIGFGFCTVLATLLVISQADQDRQGAAAGMFGFVSSVSTVAAPSIGLWLLERGGNTVYIVTALTTMAFAPAVFLGKTSTVKRERSVITYRSLLASAEVRRPLLALLGVTMMFGGIYSFMPVIAHRDAKVVLIVFGVCMAISRTASGRVADRHRADLLVVFSVGLAALGTAFVAVNMGLWLVLVGAALAGLGVGSVMTGSLVLVLARVGGPAMVAGSTLWNTCIDAGLAFGGFGLGFVAFAAGPRSVFYACLVVLLVLLPVTIFDSLKAPA